LKYELKSHFAAKINSMLKYRAALGYSTVNYRWVLANFDRYCLRHFPELTSLTKELALAWCNDAKGISGYRAPAIREFARHLISLGETAFVLPPSFFPAHKADLPYLLSETELECFFNASDRFPSSPNSPLLEYTVPVIFRLQYACGLRPHEARMLKRADFNFSDNTLYIVDSKHRKDRKLALSADVMKMCKKYDRIAETLIPGRIYFFQSPTGKAYSHGWLTAKFHKCWALSGMDSKRGSCVPYDLRHNYATHTLMKWVEEGKDLNAWIPYLTAYMGHAAFSSTFYYVHLLPERLSKMDFMRTGGIIPEVESE
jgi:integrase